jgi:DNA modification methylase
VPANIVGFAELDPPYAINYEYAYHNDTEDDADWKLEDLEDGLSTIFTELQRVMMDDSWVLCWTGYEHILWIQELAAEKGFHIQHPGVWVKPNGGRTNSPSVIMKSCHEHFLLFRKGKAMFSTPSFSNVITCDTTSGDRIHKWEKPIDLYRKFFQAMAKPGSYFLSPFAGSGNAMITATFFDMVPLGCELSNKYFYQFYRRLKNYYMEG